MTPQETDSDLPVSVQESLGKAWVGGGLLQDQAGTGQPGGLPSLGLHRVGHDRGDLAAAAAVLGAEDPKRGQLSLPSAALFIPPPS